MYIQYDIAGNILATVTGSAKAPIMPKDRFQMELPDDSDLSGMMIDLSKDVPVLTAIPEPTLDQLLQSRDAIKQSLIEIEQKISNVENLPLAAFLKQ